MDIFVVQLSKEKKKTQITSVGNEIGDVVVDSANIKKKIGHTINNSTHTNLTAEITWTNLLKSNHLNSAINY